MGSRNGGGAPTMIRRRQSDFKMSFNLALRSLLTTCSKERKKVIYISTLSGTSFFFLILTASSFLSKPLTNGATDHIQVITTLHGSIEVGTALNTVGQLVEEQCLDHFFSDKTNVMDAVHNLSTAKKAESQYLRNLLERVGNELAEGQNRLIQAQVELHKNKNTEKSRA
ncbi:hypothetical protein Goari_012085 [Gossypium aridum]|uniref:Uncharacterized protein n=1 Tax=Gossypium aridum TaxID=34290 RepID=A0A7J8WZJ6_GOSAI|nr:hypothetical protein [Gossypium aridum]